MRGINIQRLASICVCTSLPISVCRYHGIFMSLSVSLSAYSYFACVREQEKVDIQLRNQLAVLDFFVRFEP